MASGSAVRDDDRERTPPWPRAGSKAPPHQIAGEFQYQQRMLARIVRGDALGRTLNAICRRVEQWYPGSHCTVLVLDRSGGVLRHAASPTLPRRFARQIDGLPVGEGMGVCGTAAARGEVTMAEDIMTSPLTRAFVDLAEQFNLRSVWSYPLTRAGGEVIGTFAVYRSEPHTPSRTELKFVSAAGNMVALAVDHDRAERALQAAVNFDSLTGLPNRARFLELVNAELNVSGQRVTLMMVQIDRFQQINHSVGQIAGDQLLLETSRRLREALGDQGLVARFAGDTFMLMVAELKTREVGQLTERVEAAMSQPFHADGLELLLTGSIGISMSDHATDAFGLVREAEAAIQAARAAGAGHHQVYDRKLRAQQIQRLRTESQLRRAIERDELVMHYQPILSVEDRSWSGVEALVRWRHPQRGLLAPDEFIPLAEETGLIVPLGKRVLEMVCAQAHEWAETLPGIRIAINASAVELVHPATAADIKATIGRAGLPPSAVIVEVTESALMAELDTARAALEELQDAGVQVLLDDFGTGYSSLARLGELPISGLKIDRRFARGLGRDPAVMPVVRAIADLARAYGLQVVVEGIEDGAALSSVDELHCEFAQGYHLGRPAPPDQVEQLLAAPLSPVSGIA